MRTGRRTSPHGFEDARKQYGDWFVLGLDCNELHGPYYSAKEAIAAADALAATGKGLRFQTLRMGYFVHYETKTAYKEVAVEVLKPTKQPGVFIDGLDRQVKETQVLVRREKPEYQIPGTAINAEVCFCQ